MRLLDYIILYRSTVEARELAADKVRYYNVASFTLFVRLKKYLSMLCMYHSIQMSQDYLTNLSSTNLF